MQDPEGFYYLVDRKKDVIVSGGENIYPVQIEDFIRKFNKVKDVAVIGLPDKRLGEKTAAIIEIKEGFTCTKEEIEEFCNALPRYKRPKEILFEEIPRNATGKIEKPKLREIYCGKRLAEEQAVVGVVAAGIERHNVDVPLEVKLQFVGSTLQIEQRNI